MHVFHTVWSELAVRIMKSWDYSITLLHFFFVLTSVVSYVSIVLLLFVSYIMKIRLFKYVENFTSKNKIFR